MLFTVKQKVADKYKENAFHKEHAYWLTNFGCISLFMLIITLTLKKSGK